MIKARKVVFLALALCMMLSLMTTGAVAQSSNSPYKYKITPDSQDWAKYKPYELFELTNIPEITVKNMSTAELVSTVMDYPFLGDIFAFDSIDDGIAAVSERFSGLKELMSRKDAGSCLFNEYEAIEQNVTANPKNDKNKTIMKEMIVEELLSQPAVFKQLSEVQVSSIIGLSNVLSEELGVTKIGADRKSPFSVAAAVTASYLYYTVYTPKGSAVSVFARGEELTPAQKSAMDSEMASRYPGATRLQSATTNYNCHSYAWYWQSTSNAYWMNDPSKYMSDGSYIKVGFLPTAAGQKLYYPVTGGHSAVVYSTASSIWNVVLTSKWGAYGLYRHKYGIDPYGNGALALTSWRR
ncbi:MAG TPA: hypothetical protein VGK02_01485 [Candidatus Aquicultor sp.]|jgi:hypothetical protein